MHIQKMLEGLKNPETARVVIIKDINPLGGTKRKRTVYIPNQEMKKLHQQLIDYLRSLHINLPHAAGALPKTSPKKNVEKHRKNRFFYLVDLKEAYQAVDGWELAKILRKIDPKLGTTKEIANFLGKYCMAWKVIDTPYICWDLLTGAPASPDLFNIYAGFVLDLLLAELCGKYNIIFTRYLDDLIFSSKQKFGKVKRKKIREVIEKAGFKINHRKSRVLDLKKGPICINGVGLEFGGRIFLPRHFTRKLFGLIHKAQKDPKLKNRIHGLMGVFWDITDPFKLNKTEKKLIKKYRRLCLVK